MNNQKYCVWMITGGTTHAFCCLSACIQYAIKSDRIVLPYSENHPYYGDKFYSFYRLNDESPLSQYFVDEKNYTKVRDSYIPPFNGMPSKLMNSLITGPKPDSYGKQRYYLEGITEVENNERYLDYPKISNENKPYIITWGRHDKYWKNQVTCALNTLNPSTQLHSTISKYLREIRAQINQNQFIGVHFRNTDYESDFELIIQKTYNLALKHDLGTVFWATDDMSSKEKAQEKLNKKGLSVIFSTNIVDHKKVNSKNLHSISNKQLEQIGSSKVEQLAIFYAEMIILGNSNLFLPSTGTIPLLVEGITRSKGQWSKM